MITEITKLAANKTRVGRGISSGQGKTAGRGTKGQNSRSGNKRYRGFGSGAMSFAQRLPKYSGIKPSKGKVTITTAQIDPLTKEKDIINRAWLVEQNLLSPYVKQSDTVKIVLKGTQAKAYTLGEDVRASKTVKTA